MFCQKCGKEMNDGAMFCVSCGAKLGEPTTQGTSNNTEGVQSPVNEQANTVNEPAQGAQQNNQGQQQYNQGQQQYDQNQQQNGQNQQQFNQGNQQNYQGQQPRSGELPPIIANLKKFGLGFFSRRDMIGNAAESMGDNSWSGIIMAGAGILITSLILLISFNNATKDFSSSYLEGMAGKLFLLSFVTMAVIFFATAGGMFIVINNFLKKSISFGGAVNLVAYTSMIMICATIINLIVNMIWAPLSVIISIVAFMATLFLMYSAIEERYKVGKALFGPYIFILTVLLIVILLITGLTMGSIISEISKLQRYIW